MTMTEPKQTAKLRPAMKLLQIMRPDIRPEPWMDFLLSRGAWSKGGNSAYMHVSSEEIKRLAAYHESALSAERLRADDYAEKFTTAARHVQEVSDKYNAERLKAQGLVEALKIATSLTKKYLSRVSFEGLNDREITELREVNYQAMDALGKYAKPYASAADDRGNTK